MESKNLFTRFVLFLLVISFAGGIYIPIHYNMPYPAHLAPEFDAVIKSEYGSYIETNQPEIVLIGDSVLKDGVDQDLLTGQLGINTYTIPVPGSGTAAWYLLLKNVIMETEHKPKYVFVLFRNTMLTVPQYRTTGKYFPLLDDFATANEPLLVDLAFVDQMSPMEKFAKKYIPYYSARFEMREDLDNLIRYKPSSLLLNCDRDCTNEAVGSIFGREVDSGALNQILEDAAETLYAPVEMDFEEQVDKSFLPYIIQLAQNNDVHLVFVRTKIFANEPAALDDYTAKLDLYLSTQDNVHVLDFSEDPRITRDFYTDPLHMNAYGRQQFTGILADSFLLIK